MKRIEELLLKTTLICNDPKNDYKSTEDLCLISMEWADETMIDRVCEFIKKKFTETIVGNVISRHETTINEVINDLRKEMEGEII